MWITVILHNKGTEINCKVKSDNTEILQRFWAFQWWFWIGNLFINNKINNGLIMD